MPDLKPDDRCLYCKHNKLWKTNYSKANCDLKKKPQGFYPEETIPRECVGKPWRK